MKRLDITADRLVSALLTSVDHRQVSILDSCGVGHLGSHLMIAGINPVETIRLGSEDPSGMLDQFQSALNRGFAAVFTISYDFGGKPTAINSKPEKGSEPDVYLALYDSLIVHDYQKEETFLTGNIDSFDEILLDVPRSVSEISKNIPPAKYRSNFTFNEYTDAIETIKEFIRRGDTYQVNLTIKLSVELDDETSPQRVFACLRRDHPAPFAAFIDRGDSYVVSASPERFFSLYDGIISASPIKGTRPQGISEPEDKRLQVELLQSEKDRAENTMIVDLLRNDLGRVCEFGSVDVKKLCDLEVHPTLCHLVSTIEGRVRSDATFVDILRALFPCGSITGAPKIRTMEIIDELEPNARGLSMGAIGYFIPKFGFDGMKPGIDVSVAIRTMVIREGVATFNVGGGITIDSDPQEEYNESLLKAKALLAALGNK
ncbi:MAG: aminodeoxychorismate synthase component I [Pyrinomonadaceae bacterium]